MDFVKTNSAYFMAIYLFLQLLRFRSIDIKVKLIENLSRRHFIISLVTPKFWVKLQVNY